MIPSIEIQGWLIELTTNCIQYITYQDPPVVVLQT